MKFTIIAQQGCEYCAKARGLMFDHGYEFNYIHIDNKPEYKELLKAIGFPTVPIIFVQKEEGYPSLIGTYEDLDTFINYRGYLK